MADGPNNLERWRGATDADLAHLKDDVERQDEKHGELVRDNAHAHGELHEKINNLEIRTGKEITALKVKLAVIAGASATGGGILGGWLSRLWGG